MSEFRQDPFTGRWCLFAEGRSARPNEYVAPSYSGAGAAGCPFCEGHESRTPPELAAVRPAGGPPNGPGWTVRSIPNRFPSVSLPAVGPAPARARGSPTAPGTGEHEVIVTSPTHSPSFARLAPSQLRDVFRFFRERVRRANGRAFARSVLLFENKGPESGGTLPHPHAQLVASAQVGPREVEEAAAFGRGRRSSRTKCALEAVVRGEVDAGERVIVEDAHWVVLSPFASEHPYESWLVPRRHTPSLADANDPELDRLAELLPRLLRALDGIHPGVSYNWFVHGVPPRASAVGRFHWHVEVLPRLVRPDGYELGTGTRVNAVLPERAARELRDWMDGSPPLAVPKR